MPLRESARPSRPARPARNDDNAPDEREATPARGRSSRRSADEVAEPPRRGRAIPRPDSSDDADEPPARSRRGGEEKERSRPRARGGWDAAEETLAATARGGVFFKVEYKQEYVLAFQEEEPFANYVKHWIPTKGGRPYTCLRDEDGNGCPVCDETGDKGQACSAFDVIVFDVTTGDPTPMVWETTSSITKILREYTKEKQVNLTDGYWLVSKTKIGSGDKGSTQYNISRVKERDLKEDYNYDPITDKEFDEFVEDRHTDEWVTYPTRAELRALVDENLRR